MTSHCIYSRVSKWRGEGEVDSWVRLGKQNRVFCSVLGTSFQQGLWHICSILCPAKWPEEFRLWKLHKKNSQREEPRSLVWRRAVCGTRLPISTSWDVGLEINYISLCIYEGESWSQWVGSQGREVLAPCGKNCLTIKAVLRWDLPPCELCAVTETWRPKGKEAGMWGLQPLKSCVKCRRCFHYF